MSRAKKRFWAEHGRAPAMAELARETGIPEKELAKYYEVQTPVRDLATRMDGEEGNLLDIIPHKGASPEKVVSRKEISAILHSIICDLPKEEAEVIRAFFGIGTKEKTIQDIADQQGRWRPCIRKTRIRVLEKIRRRLKAHGIETPEF